MNVGGSSILTETSARVIHSQLQSKKCPAGRMSESPSNPTRQCRGINADYLPMLFLDINEKSLDQIMVQGMLKKKLRNHMTSVLQTYKDLLSVTPIQ